MSDIIGHNEPLYRVICNKCKHHHFSLSKSSCDAFEVIPKGILTGEIKHDVPLKNQKNNIVFEPIDE